MTALNKLAEALASEVNAARDLYWAIARNPNLDVEVGDLRSTLHILGRSPRDLQDDTYRLKHLAELRELGDPTAAQAAAAGAAAAFRVADAKHGDALAAVEVAKAGVEEANSLLRAAQVRVEAAAAARRDAAQLEVALFRRGCPTFANTPAVQAAEAEQREQERLRAEQAAQASGRAAEAAQATSVERHLAEIAAPGTFVARRTASGGAASTDATAEEARLSASVLDGSLASKTDATEGS